MHVIKNGEVLCFIRRSLFHFKFFYIICSQKYPYLFPSLLKSCGYMTGSRRVKVLKRINEVKQREKIIVIGVPKRNPEANPDFHQCSVFQSTEKFSSDVSVLIQCSDNTHLIESDSIHDRKRSGLNSAHQCGPLTYRVCDLLVDLKLYVWTMCSYYDFVRERKFIPLWIKHNLHSKSSAFKS